VFVCGSHTKFCHTKTYDGAKCLHTSTIGTRSPSDRLNDGLDRNTKIKRDERDRRRRFGLGEVTELLTLVPLVFCALSFLIGQ